MFNLVQWHVWQSPGAWFDWGVGAATVSRELVPDIILTALTAEIELIQPCLEAARTPAGT